MAYSRGTSTNIIVGAAALFVADTTLARLFQDQTVHDKNVHGIS
jgi:hypothetical protein